MKCFYFPPFPPPVKHARPPQYACHGANLLHLEEVAKAKTKTKKRSGLICNQGWQINPRLSSGKSLSLILKFKCLNQHFKSLQPRKPSFVCFSCSLNSDSYTQQDQPYLQTLIIKTSAAETHHTTSVTNSSLTRMRLSFNYSSAGHRILKGNW